MNVDEISNHFHNLSDEKKDRFLLNFEILVSQVENAMALRGPYRFVLDSNIIMRLEDLERQSFQEGILSVMLFFDFYKKQSIFHADLIVTPVVFYEFFRLQNVVDLKEYWDKFKSIRALIEDTLGIEVSFERLESFEAAEHYIKCIEHDAGLIKERLLEIEHDDFRYDFIRIFDGVEGVLRNDGTVEVSPICAADHLYEEMETTYFHPRYVSEFLKDHMAYKLANNPNNNQKVAKKYEDDYHLRHVVHLDNKGRVRGLADIELLWKCNVRDQFNEQSRGNYYPASVPLTIDENLFISLKDLFGYGVYSGEFVGGQEKDVMHTKLDSAFDDAKRRMTRANEQRYGFIKSYMEYIEGVRLKFCVEEADS